MKVEASNGNQMESGGDLDMRETGHVYSVNKEG